MARKKFELGMVVKGDGELGIITAINVENDNEVAVDWFDDEAFNYHSWYDGDDLEIIADPIKEYRKMRRTYFLSVDGQEIARCKSWDNVLNVIRYNMKKNNVNPDNLCDWLFCDDDIISVEECLAEDSDFYRLVRHGVAMKIEINADSSKRITVEYKYEKMLDKA